MDGFGSNVQNDRMTDLAARIEALDEGLFREIEPDMSSWDIRCLLALHGTVAASGAPFAYLEIGSYHGGSLQALIRDPRCDCAMSIDPRPAETPDKARGTYVYEDNTTELMIELLSRVPSADIRKLSTFEASTEEMRPADLSRRPNFCFIDGEHTDEAVLRDARFCADAVAGAGVLAFHDYQMVEAGIRAFLKEAWQDVSHAIAFAGHVFAVELGGARMLQAPIVDRAIASRWHSAVWRVASRPRRSAIPLLVAWSAVSRVDLAVAAARRRRRRS